MPYINLKMYPGRTEEQKREVARRILAAVMEVCNVTDPSICPVVIEEVAREEWSTQVQPEVEAKKAGLRVDALLCCKSFHPDTGRESQNRWVVQAVRAAEALGVPALRIDSAMGGQAALPLDERIRIFAEGVEAVLAATPDSQVA